jgi:hypothetical protein
LLSRIQLAPSLADKLAISSPLIAEITDMSLRTLLTTLLATCSFSLMAATEIVPLNYHTSADMLPVAQDRQRRSAQDRRT